MSNIETERTQLYPTEVADLQLAAYGYSRKQVAAVRGGKIAGVANRQGNIYKKLDVFNITHAVTTGVRRGDIFLPDLRFTGHLDHQRIERAKTWTLAMEQLLKEAITEGPVEKT